MTLGSASRFAVLSDLCLVTVPLMCAAQFSVVCCPIVCVDDFDTGWLAASHCNHSMTSQPLMKTDDRNTFQHSHTWSARLTLTENESAHA